MDEKTLRKMAFVAEAALERAYDDAPSDQRTALAHGFLVAVLADHIHRFGIETTMGMTGSALFNYLNAEGELRAATPAGRA